jgi:hypothetical protein
MVFSASVAGCVTEARTEHLLSGSSTSLLRAGPGSSVVVMSRVGVPLVMFWLFESCVGGANQKWCAGEAAYS